MTEPPPVENFTHFTLLRRLAYCAVKQFFYEVRVVGVDPLEEGPTLIVANHPNVMLDGLLVLGAYRRPLWVVAKATLFKPAIAAEVLRWLHFIPVNRRQDNPGPLSNEKSFEDVCDRLAADGAVLIFPEGQSVAERSLQPVKTGAARIALQFEDERAFRGGLRIQPVGLTYLEFERFRSAVTVTLGEPIEVEEYAELFEQDSQRAVLELSRGIEEALLQLTAVVSKEHVPLVDKIARLYRAAGRGVDDRQRIVEIARIVERLAPSDPRKAFELERRLDQYFYLSDSLAMQALAPHRAAPLWALPFLVPLAFLGLLVSYPIYRLIGDAARRAARDSNSQRASWALSLGFFALPMWYGLLALIIGTISGSIGAALFLFLLLLVSGYVTNEYFSDVSRALFHYLWPAKTSPVEVLDATRDALLDDLEHIRSQGLLKLLLKVPPSAQRR